VALDLVDGGVVDHRADVHALAVAWSDGQGVHAFQELLAEVVVDGVLDVEAVGGDAGLAAVAELGGGGLLGGEVEVGVVEDDQRRVAAELEGEVDDALRGLLDERRADGGGAREGDLADGGVIEERVADGGGARRGDDVHGAGGQAGLGGELADREGGVGRELGGLDHRGAAAGEGGPELARDHGGGEVPRRDERADAHGLADREDALVAGARWGEVAVEADALAGGPLDEGAGVGDLAAGLSEGLALLGGHEGGEAVLVALHEPGELGEGLATLGGGRGAPGGEGFRGGVRGAGGVGGPGVGDVAERGVRRGVDDGQGRARPRGDALAADVEVALRDREGHGEIPSVGWRIRFSDVSRAEGPRGPAVNSGARGSDAGRAYVYTREGRPMNSGENHEAPIRSTFAGDPDMQELVEFFVGQMPDRVDALRASFESGSLEELRSLAHQLKGAGGSYGFPQITDSARRLEERTMRADLDEVRRELDELVGLCNRTSV